jgi:hypothetical protein
MTHKTWGITVPVSDQNAEVLVPILRTHLPKTIIQEIEAAGGRATSSPSMNVSTHTVINEETGESYIVHDVSVRCQYTDKVTEE